jgi:mannose-6-phosphate isomerase-like protein (cupin superfamily)
VEPPRAGLRYRREASRARGKALTIAVRSPLATWLPDGAALARFRRRLGGAPIALPPQDIGWRRLAPGWTGALALARAGLPFHLVSDRRYDRSGDRRRLRRALDSGATAYLPQAHEVLPRVARMMVAIRASLLGPLREECSFLFIVKGRGREGMGLHHDGRVDAFWVQLEGRRTVTFGPPVRPGTAEDLPNALADRGGPGWRTIDLTPGTLFYLPPFTPHRVLCHGRSLALSLTWSAPPRRTASARARVASLATWPVVSGRATPIPSASSDRLWTQVPTVLEPDAACTRLWTPAGHIRLPRSARELARHLATMPSFPRTMRRGRHREAIDILQAHGILDPHDLPQAIVPADPAALDGWRFR